MFTPKAWANDPAGNTPITAAELVRIEQGIADANPRTVIALSADQVINNATAGAFSDLTGLSIPMLANTTYEFTGTIWWSVAATTTGFRWGLAGPTGTLTAAAEYLTSTSAEAIWAQSISNAAIAPTMVATTTSAFAAPLFNQLTYVGMVTCGATAGSLRVQFASELASTALTVKRGSSLSYKAV